MINNLNKLIVINELGNKEEGLFHTTQKTNKDEGNVGFVPSGYALLLFPLILILIMIQQGFVKPK